VQPSRLAKDLAQTPDPKLPGTPVRMVGLHAKEAAEATLLPFFARATGVSPPWFRFALATVIVFCGLTFRTADSAFRTTAGSRQPLLVHDVRSLHKAPFAMHKRTFARAASVSPPWFGELHVVPRELNTVRRLANAKPGAAGVSPPGFGEPHTVPRESNFVQRLANT
jgi:hypothetical protein